MTLNTYLNEIIYQDEPCVELCAGGYYALFAPKIGGLMLRLKDVKNNFEILRFSESVSMQSIRENPVVHGLPTLYLPNRLHNGLLKTSEKTYNLPINEPAFGNFIHGFLHLREYTVTKISVIEDSATVSAEYIYDEKDEFFKFLPISFKAIITYTLSEKGLEQNFTIENLSTAVLPVGVASHTAMNCIFSDNSNKDDLRININVDKKLPLNEHLVSTGELLELNEYDLQYKNGTLNPLTTSIDNDMYSVLDVELNDKFFYGVKISDCKTGETICYETGKEYKFWLLWNEWGNKGYCCPEPMSWMIDAPNLPLFDDKTGYVELKKGEKWSGYQHIFSYKK